MRLVEVGFDRDQGVTENGKSKEYSGNRLHLDHLPNPDYGDQFCTALYQGKCLFMARMPSGTTSAIRSLWGVKQTTMLNAKSFAF